MLIAQGNDGLAKKIMQRFFFGEFDILKTYEGPSLIRKLFTIFALEFRMRSEILTTLHEDKHVVDSNR